MAEFDVGHRPVKEAQGDCRTSFLNKHGRNGCSLLRAQTGVDSLREELWVALLVASDNEITGGLGERLRGVFRRRGDLGVAEMERRDL